MHGKWDVMALPAMAFKVSPVFSENLRKEKALQSYPQAAFAGCFGHPLKAACG